MDDFATFSRRDKGGKGSLELQGKAKQGRPKSGSNSRHEMGRAAGAVNTQVRICTVAKGIKGLDVSALAACLEKPARKNRLGMYGDGTAKASRQRSQSSKGAASRSRSRSKESRGRKSKAYAKKSQGKRASHTIAQDAAQIILAGQAEQDIEDAETQLDFAHYNPPAEKKPQGILKNAEIGVSRQHRISSQIQSIMHQIKTDADLK